MIYVKTLYFLTIFAMAAVSSAHNCTGYFCDKKMNQIHIVMTHNSLSDRSVSDNQKYDLVQQFKDGVRGFNFDLRSYNEGKGNGLFTCHGRDFGSCYNPAGIIQDLIDELNKSANRNEFIIIQVQNDGMIDNQIDTLTNMFGNLLVDDIDDYLKEDLKETIEANKRVFLTTSKDPKPLKKFFLSGTVIGENDYEWYWCRRTVRKKNRREMPTDCRTDPETKCRSFNTYNGPGYSILLMNSFCGRIPSEGTARYVNKKCRLLKNAERFRDSGNFRGGDYNGGNRNLPNILMVDFYNEGDVFGAQKCLRDGNIGGDGCETCEKDED